MTLPYRLFEVTGIELEYAIVNVDLEPRCLVEQLFSAAHGRPTSDLHHRGAGFSNELAAHVLEIKTLQPEARLDTAENNLYGGLQWISGILAERCGARLLPTGMHPWMTPGQTDLWPRAGRRIYRTYDRIFGVRKHGWLNVQSMHVNLPFGEEAEACRLHNALAALMPYLPALAASSPYVEGKRGPCMDNRLGFYASNQERFPEITGSVIPEYFSSFADYRRRVFAPMFAAVADVDPERILRHEWLNSRGEILRFNRSAIELRVLDTQECVRMDVAIAAFVRAVSRGLCRALALGTIDLPHRDVLLDDYAACVQMAGGATVLAPHLRTLLGDEPESRSATRNGKRVPVSVLLAALVSHAQEHATSDEAPYLELVASAVRGGSLAERIVKAVESADVRSQASLRRRMASVYGELADCLAENRAWENRW